MAETQPGPQIVEAYKNYSPPFDVSKTIRLCLEYVPTNYLNGLRTIVLTNKATLSHDQRRRKPLSRGKKYSMDRVLGTYYQEWKGRPAWIEIFVDEIITRSIPKGARSRILRDIAFAEVLYHEIGHHIHKDLETRIPRTRRRGR